MSFKIKSIFIVMALSLGFNCYSTSLGDGPQDIPDTLIDESKDTIDTIIDSSKDEVVDLIDDPREGIENIVDTVGDGLDTAEAIACAAVLCVYGLKYGGGDDAACAGPLGNYFSIVKKVGSFVKRVSCPLTIAERIFYLERCEDNTYSLEDIVTCDLE